MVGCRFFLVSVFFGSHKVFEIYPYCCVYQEFVFSIDGFPIYENYNWFSQSLFDGHLPQVYGYCE